MLKIAAASPCPVLWTAPEHWHLTPWLLQTAAPLHCCTAPQITRCCPAARGLLCVSQQSTVSMISPWQCWVSTRPGPQHQSNKVAVTQRAPYHGHKTKEL